MQFPTRKQKILIALLIYFLSLIISVNLLILKRDALEFHTRDYNYFIEQAARLTDPGLAKSFALQIEGYNVLGLQGIEGVKNLYHAIHTEYFRYLYVMLYGIFRNPLPLFVFFSLIFYLPIFYFAILPHSDERAHTRQWALFTLLYLLFPATLDSVTADLRPRVLLAAVWCLSLLAIHYNRPLAEKLIFFLLLIGVREEGIFLGAVLIGLNYLRMEGGRDRSLQTRLFILLDITALLAFLVFMRWGGYTRVDDLFNPLNYLQLLLSKYMLFILISASLFLVLLWHSWKKNRALFRNILYLACYSVAIGLAGFQWLRDTFGWLYIQSPSTSVSDYDLLIMAVTDHSTALVFYLLIALVVILWEFTRRAARKALVAVYASMIVFSLAITLNHYPSKIAGWRENVPSARLVWNFAAAHNRYNTKVLLDYATYQAFYNFNQVIVYNRLPLENIHPEDRYYPQNKSFLVKQIRSGMDYAVVSRESLDIILELSMAADLPTGKITLSDRYAIVEFTARPSDQNTY